ncbi:hypothetical protein IWX49DRAFT_410601 [Phyllosticta citricarpa]
MLFGSHGFLILFLHPPSPVPLLPLTWLARILHCCHQSIRPKATALRTRQRCRFLLSSTRTCADILSPLVAVSSSVQIFRSCQAGSAESPVSPLELENG